MKDLLSFSGSPRGLMLALGPGLVSNESSQGQTSSNDSAGEVVVEAGEATREGRLRCGFILSICLNDSQGEVLPNTGFLW